MGWRKRLDEIIGLDLRSLALFRIGIALVILYDLSDRIQDLPDHYTDAGVIPVATLLSIYGSRVYASLHVLASGSLITEVLVFGLHALVAVALLLGYRTRLATALCWYLSLSLQVRVAPFFRMGGDSYVGCMLLFGIFLPLGAYWSWDRRKGRIRAQDGDWVISVATLAFILQVCSLYWLTGWQKTGDSWLEGRAVWYMANLKVFASPLAPWLAEQQWAIAPLTYTSLFIEKWWTLLVFVPRFTAVSRMICIVTYFLLHFGMGLFLFLGPYPIMSMVGWLPLLPARFWDRWLPSATRALGLGKSVKPAGREASSMSSTPSVSLSGSWGPGFVGLLAKLIPGLLIFYVLVYSAGTMRVFGFAETDLPDVVYRAGRAIGLNNSWGMMAPNPGDLNWWLVVDGQLASGAHADPFVNRVVSYEEPEDVLKDMRSWRWRLNLAQLVSSEHGSLRRAVRWQAFGDYLCRGWNRDHSGPERLLGGRFVWVIEVIKPFHVEPPARLPLETFDCSRS